MKLQRPYSFIVSTLLLCSASGMLAAQSLHAGASYATGHILNIYPGFPSAERTHTATLELSKTNKDIPWRRAHHNPTTGFVLSYTYFGNPDVLGWGVGLQYRYERSQKLLRRFSLFESLLTGAMYFSKPFDIAKNPTNIANGSQFSFLVNAEIGLQYTTKGMLNFRTGLRYIHTSNAHTTLPNVGINIPALFIAMSVPVQRKSDEFIVTPFTLSDSLRRWKVHIQGGLGLNENGGSTKPSNGPLYPIYMFTAGAAKRVSNVGRLLLITQLYYNTGYRTYISSQELTELANNARNASVWLISAGYELLVGHFGFSVHGGFNLHNPFLKYYLSQGGLTTGEKVKSMMPGKFGVTYYLYDPYRFNKANFFFSTHVKSNLGQADFLEMGWGIEF